MGKEDPDRAHKEEIQRIFDHHQGNYGYRRIHAQLRATGRKLNHKRVQGKELT